MNEVLNSDSWRLIVSGRVQGVGYRYHTRRTAVSLGLSGWVRNLDDGNVEIRAEGDPTTLAQLETWCKQGPPSSQVTEVKVERGLACESFTDFKIR